VSVFGGLAGAPDTGCRALSDTTGHEH